MLGYKALQKRIQELESVLGRKKMENEILNETVRIDREKILSHKGHCAVSRISNDSDLSFFRCVEVELYA